MDNKYDTEVRPWLQQRALMPDSCRALSPESKKPCYLPQNHEGAHEAVLGPWSTASWANPTQT